MSSKAPHSVLGAFRRRLLAGELGPPRGRHAGADHLVDVFLKVLSSIEHFAGPQHRRKNAQTRLRDRGTRGDTIFLDESNHLLQHGEIGVPVFEQIADVVGGAQGRTAASGTIGRVRRREVDSFLAQHERGERLCAGVDPRNRREFEGRAIHGSGTLRFSIRMDDTSSKGSAQGKGTVADEQGAQAHLSRVTTSTSVWPRRLGRHISLALTTAWLTGLSGVEQCAFGLPLH